MFGNTLFLSLQIIRIDLVDRVLSYNVFEYHIESSIEGVQSGNFDENFNI